MGRDLDYSVPHRATTDLADLRAAKREALEACWRMEHAIAEAVAATNRVRRLMGLPEVDPFRPFPGAEAMDAAAAKAGWAELSSASRIVQPPPQP